MGRITEPSSSANEHEALLALEILPLLSLRFLQPPPNMLPLRSCLLIMIRLTGKIIQSGLGCTDHTVHLCIASPPGEHHPRDFAGKPHSHPSSVHVPYTSGNGVCGNKSR